MSTRREENSSEESKSSGKSADTKNTQNTLPTEMSSASPPPSKDLNHPPLWTSSDPPGRKGMCERHRRKMRLEKSISLNPEDLHDILRFIYENGDQDDSLSPHLLYTYVPRTFETGVVSNAIAAYVLREALIRNLFKLFPTVHTHRLRLGDGHKIFEFLWRGVEPTVRGPLQNLPNLRFVEQELHRIKLESVKTGGKLIAADSFSLRLDDTSSFWTLAYIATLENLGACRHVIVTAGHVAGDTPSIKVQDDTNTNTYSLQPVPPFTRTLGIPRFRMQKPVGSARVSLNESCLLETVDIPANVLQCSFLSIDCNVYNPSAVPDEDPRLVARDPKLGDMSKLRDRVNEGRQLVVHKYGAASGYTTGTLFDIERHDGEVVTYNLLIQWNSPEQPFAMDGDSGSLVWAKEGETIVPLGIHCGSEGEISYSLSLWSFCEEISSTLDADIFFCDFEECGEGSIFTFEA